MESLELMSSAGRQRMLRQPLLTERAAAEAEYNRLQTVIDQLNTPESQRHVSTIRHQFMQMHDLHGTIANIGNHVVVDEIELFELKSFAFLCMETAKASTAIGLDCTLAVPDMEPVFALLDPDGTRIPNFYFYDSYHPDLAPLRRRMAALQTAIEQSAADNPGLDDMRREQSELFERQNAIQHAVAAQLSDALCKHHSLLCEAYDRMAYADFLFAKAFLATQWNLVRPVISGGLHTSLHGLFNPRLLLFNKEHGLRYQPIDIELQNGVCLITGANMAGKTVLLKTVGIAHLMAQFGFYVPAAEASIALVDDVVFCIGDEQNEMKGLSSFASEIIKISNALQYSATHRLLLLIDEPARTTNPSEGKALVQSVAHILDKRSSSTLITTHYSQLGLPCRRLRVRGFVENMSDKTLTPDNINDFMDYSLLSDDSDDVPQEALRIASILDCDRQMIETARQFLAGN